MLSLICDEYGRIVNFVPLKTYRFEPPSFVVDGLRRMPEYKLWWKHGNISWNGDMKDPPIDELPMRLGMGLSFNMATMENLLDYSIVSDDFKHVANRSGLPPTPWHTTAEENSGYVATLTWNWLTNGPGKNCKENRFYIHSPFELPGIMEGHEFGYHGDLDVMLSVEVIETDEDVRSIRLEKRQCIFQDERKLEFFKVYSKESCEMECLAQEVLAECGCVPFFYIRNSTTRVCDLKGQMCALTASTSFSKHVSGGLIAEGSCFCYPTCDQVKYDYEVLFTKYDAKYDDELSSSR
jgi:Amiloride-sensitive sodium channel